ncbi:hypothetical protein TVAG_249980 [Trichomonas vaginalis G3]|uniref:Uncharacterized protein n=1 Tax=Trichomonas vaginalis (strain ATCC PRA-98 / G3) TaxID=412133 RepID=A2DCK1_TRIV3|nr:hypothetical protein TVAGG3_0956390 [Trichomonas vaginalis G3]EAY21938.1 hypothetical protein TVAG_249980 [Trichomonas vaginalis G3]KAI5487587.1 hypothetical protein TVAGG3_0956390 [Trichomonas vaginalis G3]|eukprot:XP_001582924.1 hypothetical protein [Trichomonas vaginalis G3]
MIIHHPNAYVEFSQIIFDDPNVNYQEKYSQAAFSNGAWIAIPVRTPQPTTIVPARTSEASSSKSNSSPSGDENDNEEEPDKSKSTSGKLGTGAIVGIVIGILIAAVLVAVAVIFILKSRPKRTDTSDMDIQFANIV